MQKFFEGFQFLLCMFNSSAIVNRGEGAFLMSQQGIDGRRQTFLYVHVPGGVREKGKYNLNLKLVPSAHNFPLSNR